MFLSVLMTSVTCLRFSMQEQDILKHTNGKCHLCTLQSICRPLCNIGMHLITEEEETSIPGGTDVNGVSVRSTPKPMSTEHRSRSEELLPPFGSRHYSHK